MLQFGDLQEVPVFDGNNLNHAKMTRIVTIRVREQSERVGLVIISDGVNEMLYNCTSNHPLFLFLSDVSTACDECVVLLASVSGCMRAYTVL
jgi:hypothetical protein